MQEIAIDEQLDRLREKQYPWMSDDQFECYKMLADLFGGDHHIYGPVKSFGEGIEHNTHQDFSTFDFDYMTSAVVMAHDRMIRFSILPSGPGLIRLVFHKRHSRDGDSYKRHPTIEEATNKIRKRK